MNYSNFILSAVLMIGLIGCDSKPEPTTPVPEVENTTEPAEATVKSSVPDDAPIYKVAITGMQPPFTFLDEYGHPQGIDIDVMEAIAEVEGFHVQFYKETYEDIFPSIDTGARDILMSGLSYSEERNTNYTLSDSYIFVPSAFIYTDPSYNLSSIADLEKLEDLDLTLGGVAISKQITDIREKYPNMKFVPTDTTFLAFEKLIRGEIDVIAEDYQILEYLSHHHSNHEAIVVPYETEENLSAQQVALVTKGNTELMDRINHGIGVLKSTNEIKKIENKWLHYK